MLTYSFTVLVFLVASMIYRWNYLYVSYLPVLGCLFSLMNSWEITVFVRLISFYTICFFIKIYSYDYSIYRTKRRLFCVRMFTIILSISKKKHVMLLPSCKRNKFVVQLFIISIINLSINIRSSIPDHAKGIKILKFIW